MLNTPPFPSSAAEAEFWERQDNAQLEMRRWLLFLGALLFWVFGAMDWAVGGDQFIAIFATRCAASLGLLLIAFLFWRAEKNAQRERLMLFFGYIAIAGEISMCALAPNESVGFYLFGLAVVISFGAVLIAPRAKTIARLFFFLVASYAALSFFFDIEMLPFAISTIFVWLIAAAAMIGSFERERLERLRGVSEAKLALANAALDNSRDEALRARDKEIKANREKNRFIASVSHELRTPLNAIIGFSDVMRNELYGPVEPSQYTDYIGFIHSSGQLLQANIADLMDIARIESGKLGWTDIDFSLSDVIDQTIETCRADASEADVKLTVDDSERDVMIHADPTRMAQAIINLTTNALKFTEPGGRVSVSAKHQDDGSIEVSVQDTGRGMSAKVMEKIHEPFAQAHSDSAGGDKGGLGLGLAIVCGILEQIDSELEIESEEMVGTRASFVIPQGRVVTAQTKAA